MNLYTYKHLVSLCHVDSPHSGLQGEVTEGEKVNINMKNKKLCEANPLCALFNYGTIDDKPKK